MADKPPLDSFLKADKPDEGESPVQFLRGKPGPKGEKGEKGDEGPIGPRGFMGIAGEDGKDGVDGKNGKDGANGSRGERGFPGEKGDPGINGTDGVNGKDGSPDTGKEIIDKINNNKSAKLKLGKIQGLEDIQNQAASTEKRIQNFLSLGGSRSTAIKVSGTLLGTGINTVNFVGATGTKVGDGSEVNITTSGSGTGIVQTIVAGTGISVNSTDPANPIVTATGTGNPGGSNTQLQYNNSGAFGGIARVTTNGNDLILTGQASPTYTQGKLVYDTDNECITFFNNDSNISLQIGQESWLRVINKTGSTIANGAAVYVSGVDVTSGLQTIALAKGDAATTIIGAGLTTESIANNAIGYVTVIGVVHGLDTSGFSAGATVFVSATTAGALTSTAPTAPNYRYRVGIVGVSSATVGTINVTPSTAALGNGTANQVFGMNNAGTTQEVKSIVAGTNVTVTNTANTITIAATGGGTGTVTSVTSADANATVATTTTTPVITIVSAPKWATARNLAGNSVDGSANVAFANKFIVQGTTDAGLSGAQFLGALGTGIVKNTTTTGVLSIAIAADFPTLNQSTTGSAATLTTARTIGTVTGDATSAGSTFDGSANNTNALTLATVNSNVGSFTSANITVNAKGLITAAANGSGGTGISWTEVTGTTQSAAVNSGYILNNASLVTLTLPSTAAVGSIVEAAGKGAGGWKIAQNASGQIHYGNVNTTSGTGGSLASVNQYDSIRLVCIVANNEWVVLSSQGNITIV